MHISSGSFYHLLSGNESTLYKLNAIILQAVLLFLFISLISFTGSLQAGLVNVSVLQTALKKDLSSAVWLAAGGCIPELIYAVLAITGGMFVEQNPHLMNGLGLATIPVFLGFGIFQIFRKKNDIFQKEPKTSARSAFLHGLGLAFLNPQLLPFWFGVYIYINSSIIAVDSLLKKIAFVVGTAAGALALLLLLAWLTVHNTEKIARWLRKYDFNKLIGWLFIGLAALKIGFVLVKYI